MNVFRSSSACCMLLISILLPLFWARFFLSQSDAGRALFPSQLRLQTCCFHCTVPAENPSWSRTLGLFGLLRSLQMSLMSPGDVTDWPQRFSLPFISYTLITAASCGRYRKLLHSVHIKTETISQLIGQLQPFYQSTRIYSHFKSHTLAGVLHCSIFDIS